MKYFAMNMLLIWAFNSYGQADSKIGKKVPDLQFQKIVNFHKQEASIAEFTGKVIILDFWATWCSPCIKSFPELERLQFNFKDQLQVITITDDSEKRIEQFLSKRKLAFPVVIDEKRELAKIFPHRIIPHTIVINKQGIVQAITSSSEITEDLIKKVMADEKIALPEKLDVINFDPSKLLSESDNFTYQITIAPFREGYPSFSDLNRKEGVYKDRRIFATNLSAQTLFEIAFQFPVAVRTVVEVKDPLRLDWSRKTAICFDLIVPEELADQRFDIMKQQLGAYFNLKAEVEERTKGVKVLRIPDKGQVLNLKTSDSESKTQVSYGGKGLSMQNAPIGKLCEFLESELNLPVLDETDLKAHYDLEIPWYNENPARIYEELKKIGFELIDAERKLPVLVIKDK